MVIDAPTLAAWPFAASLVVLGMPHGAVDGALAWRLGRASGRGWTVTAAFVGLFTAVIAASVGLLVAVPRVSLTAFLVLAAVHFGSRAAVLWPRGSAPASWAIAALIVFGPFAARPAEARAVFDDAARRLGGGAFEGSWTAVMAAIGIAAAVVFVIGALVAKCRPRPWQVAIAGGVVASQAVLTPLASVGVWFLAWHAWPETLALGRRLAPEHGVVARTVRVHVVALPLLVPVVAIIAALAIMGAGGAPSVHDVAIWTLIAYAAVTPGHAAFQAWLDGEPRFLGGLSGVHPGLTGAWTFRGTGSGTSPEEGSNDVLPRRRQAAVPRTG